MLQPRLPQERAEGSCGKHDGARVDAANEGDSRCLARLRPAAAALGERPAERWAWATSFFPPLQNWRGGEVLRAWRGACNEFFTGTPLLLERGGIGAQRNIEKVGKRSPVARYEEGSGPWAERPRPPGLSAHPPPPRGRPDPPRLSAMSSRTYGTSGLDNRPLFGETSAKDRIINLVVGSLTSLLILVTLISAFVFPQLPPKPLNIFFAVCISLSSITACILIYWYRQGDLEPKFRNLIYYILFSIIMLCICANLYFHDVGR